MADIQVAAGLTPGSGALYKLGAGDRIEQQQVAGPRGGQPRSVPTLLDVAAASSD